MLKIYSNRKKLIESGKEIWTAPYSDCDLIEKEYNKKFDIESIYKLQRELAVKIDNCTIDEQQRIISPFTGTNIRVDNLSDGSRTLEFLYVYAKLKRTDFVIDITSCGTNALEYMFRNYKDFDIELLLMHLEIPQEIQVDFEYDNQLFHNTSELFAGFEEFDDIDYDEEEDD